MTEKTISGQTRPGPKMQNFPVRSGEENRRRVRELFWQERPLQDADYTELELRLTAEAGKKN